MPTIEYDTERRLPPPKPIFLYGTLRALPLLAWVVTGDSSNVGVVKRRLLLARVDNYTLYSVRNRDAPAVVRQPGFSVHGYLFVPESILQGQIVKIFERGGGAYRAKSVRAMLVNVGKRTETDIYVWNGKLDSLTLQPWCLASFINERLDDWIDILEGMEREIEDICNRLDALTQQPG